MIEDFINRDFKFGNKNEMFVSVIKQYEACDSNKSFKLNNFIILLIRSGSLKLKLNNQIKTYNAQDLISIPKNTICNILNMDELLQMYMITFSSYYFFRDNLVVQQKFLFYFFSTNNSPSISLNTTEFKLMLQLFKFIKLKKKNVIVSDSQNELMQYSMTFFFQEIQIIYSKYLNNIPSCKTRKELLVLQFRNQISIYCREQHSVQFFADTLCITPGYLNRIVKQITDKTAKDLICEGLLIEAKILLKNSQITIFNIADELEFNNYSSFSTFFKRHTSLSPSEYRLQLNPH
ncbi:helix-turn-helix domain-containing protein [Flavobacterium hydatis]|uniref:HTH araC/xylS-type domain-containing protein n=1 Tax=Flavobacterium hydatis TaxID=991 RepID=A0A086AIR1_FLAHY|nr:helix-turn-helix domain-containing protein [Flavobacterium hydatis]KFF16575.1 hypothetical protein IW20_10430 [Flavobacterium hydatis]OXA90233.1 hypothetical protein B0A62_19360 [Flavobacterium hydatis]